MLSVVLKILSILGILLLCLLGLALLIILLVLFFPIYYRITGKKNAEMMTAGVRISWLFGFLRVRFDFPEPGKVLVKILPFTVYDSGKLFGEDTKETAQRENEKKAEKSVSKSVQDDKKVSEDSKESAGNQRQTAVTRENPETTRGDQAGQEPGLERGQNDQTSQDNSSATEQTDRSGQEGVSEETGGFFEKIKKLKYTICNIYDKIKNVWENISYYIELLREEETKLLFNHAVFRIGKILKSIRPRQIRGNILFGTGAPDTTGYAYGVYGMFSPFLGDRLLVTPDFSQAIFEGDIYISGHISIVTILWNGLKLLLDKKLRRFIRKMKAGRKK